MAAFLVAGVLAVSLPWAYLQAGAIVAALVTGYLCLVHLAVSLSVGKEFLVALLFAVGVAIPLIASDVELGAWLPAVAGFGFACWLNCSLIERWESALAASTGWEVWLVLPIVVCCVLSPLLVGIMLGGATGLLALLHGVRRKTRHDIARVLVDVVMMTPLIAWASHLGCD